MYFWITMSPQWFLKRLHLFLFSSFQAFEDVLSKWKVFALNLTTKKNYPVEQQTYTYKKPKYKP